MSMFEKRPLMGDAAEKAEEQKMEGQLAAFIDEKKYTADQVQEAYYQLCGVSGEGSNQAVEELRAEMERMTENRFPLNGFVKLIESRRSIEDAIPKYYQFVSGLKISENEKRVLRSVVDRTRPGSLECRVDEGVIGSIDIKKDVSSKEELANEMVMAISRILASIKPDKEYQFWFEEK